jgi:hypothetical protein
VSKSPRQDSSDPIDDRSTLRRARSVASQTLDGEAVLLHLTSGTYFTLNETGTFVWNLLEREHTLAQLLEALVGAFDVEREAARRDLVELLEDLVARGLIDRAGES